MKKVIIEVPTEVTEDEAKLYLAMKLFEEGKISLGQASNLSGYSKRALMEILGKHGVAVFDYPPEDLEKDLENV